MEEKNHPCYLCHYLYRYYTQGIKRFSPTPFGWCCKRADNVNVHGTCEKFTVRARKQKIYDRSLQYYLNELLTEISVLRNVIEVNYEQHDRQDL